MMKMWKKTLLSLTISAGLLVSSVPALAAPQQLAVQVNDQKVRYEQGAPVIEKQTTLVPLRSTLQAMGVQLNSTTKNSMTVTVDGKKATIQSPLVVIKGVTYAPIRSVAQAAGYDVHWDANTRTVQMTVQPGGTATSNAVTTPAANSETAPAAVNGGRGFMWEVQNNGNTVYLVGSMHIADDSFYPLRKEYEEAFDEADYLGVEVDINQAEGSEQQQLVMQMGMYQDGTTLKDHISPSTYAKLGKVLEQNGMKLDALDLFKPWVVEVTLIGLQASDSGYEAASGIDLYFLKQAAERKLPVIELESIESQLSMFNDFSPELQERNLLAALDSLEAPSDDVMTIEQMATMWKTGDEKALLEMTESMSGDAEYNQAMLVDRNIGMADKIDGYLKNGKNEEYFIVVGAGHYLGQDGVIQLLENKGYTVVRK